MAAVAAVLMVQVIGYATPLLPYQASPVVVAMGMVRVHLVVTDETEPAQNLSPAGALRILLGTVEFPSGGHSRPRCLRAATIRSYRELLGLGSDARRRRSLGGYGASLGRQCPQGSGL